MNDQISRNTVTTWLMTLGKRRQKEMLTHVLDDLKGYFGLIDITFQ